LKIARGVPQLTAYKSKLEARYAERLKLRAHAGEILWWAYEPINFRLGDGATYKPDFGIMLANFELEMHETKGWWREAARIRIKCAASLYPFRFIGVTHDKERGWEFEEF
jgi:hypothetical protein